MRDLVDVEGFVNIGLDDLASFENYDYYLDHCAESIGHPLLMNIDTEAVGINEDKTIRIKVTGQVETEVEEEETDGDVQPAP